MIAIFQKNTLTVSMLITVLNLSGSSSIAQVNSNSISDSIPLEQLSRYKQILYYSSGQKDRALSIADFMENAGIYFQNEIGFTPKTTLFVLAPEHWATYAAKSLKEVYGFPHNLDNENLIIAAENNDFWKSFLPPVDQLSAEIAIQVKLAYGQSDGSYSMQPFFDLLALHEMGHSYTSQAGLEMNRYWMAELFVNIMLHTYVAEKQPELLPALEAFPNMVLKAGTADYQYTSLEDFEKLYPTLGMGTKNYGWYQCKLHTAAKDIYNAGGSIVLKKLWTALKNHQESMTDSDFVGMLEREVHISVANVYLNWNNH